MVLILTGKQVKYMSVFNRNVCVCGYRNRQSIEEGRCLNPLMCVIDEITGASFFFFFTLKEPKDERVIHSCEGLKFLRHCLSRERVCPTWGLGCKISGTARCD